jgi:hypothetical protein
VRRDGLPPLPGVPGRRGPTLTEALAARGLTHRPNSIPPRHGREVVDARGEVVFEGRAHEVWAWLRTQEGSDEHFRELTAEMTTTTEETR